MLLQDSMMTIYRHNLSPITPMQLRLHSLKHCIGTCQAWSVLIKRCAYEGPDLTAEQAARTHRFITSVIPEFCLHLWRCELLLFASGMYKEAIPLVVASRAIAGYRPVNLELPRYAAGLIKFCYGKGSILDHANSGHWTITDEEIIAFAVGDMHGMYRGRGFPDLWDRPVHAQDNELRNLIRTNLWYQSRRRACGIWKSKWKVMMRKRRMLLGTMCWNWSSRAREELRTIR